MLYHTRAHEGSDGIELISTPAEMQITVCPSKVSSDRLYRRLPSHRKAPKTITPYVTVGQYSTLWLGNNIQIANGSIEHHGASLWE